MSSDLANSSNSFDRSHPTFDRARGTSTKGVQAESSASARKISERRDPQSTVDLEPLQHQRAIGVQRRGHKNELGDHGVINSRIQPTTGFLLDSAGKYSHPALLPRSENQPPDVKGKTNMDGLGVIFTKKRNDHSYRSSIGSSPLATKVSTLEDDADVHAGSPKSGEKSKDYNPRLSDDPPTTGYDTDPIQIVNLALSLSEGRRRQTYGMRVASCDQATQRSVSTTRRTNPRGARPQSTFGQYRHFERQLSRKLSPQAQVHGHTTAVKPYAESVGIAGNYRQPITTDGSDTITQDGLYDVSDATLTRVQRAKNHFELSYEHRRLLAHVPPLRRPSGAPPQSNIEGRAYNPLQCARNRKVRFREKKGTESDMEGWYDVQHVRSWVDAVVEGHTERRTDPDQCIRLPELHHLINDRNQDLGYLEVDAESSTARKTDVGQSTKLRRPRSDWVVSPGDLLADVYWLEQGLNKTKIEDRDGNNIYPRNVELKYSNWRNRNQAHEQGSQQFPPESADSNKEDHFTPSAAPALPTFTSTGRKGKYRGRGRNRERKVSTGTESSSSDSGIRRSKRLRRTLMQSHGKGSSSNNSVEGERLRAPTEPGDRENKDNATGSNAIDYYMRNMLDSDAKHSSHLSAENRSQSSMERSRAITGDHNPHDPSMVSSRERTSFKESRQSDHRPQSPDNESVGSHQSRVSLDIHRAARASLDDDTAPSSSSIHQFPSIAINLSPPQSRSPSPKKKVLHSRINPFRDKKQSKQHNAIDTADFADAQAQPTSGQRRNEAEKEPNPFDAESRDTSPMTKNIRRTSDTSIARGEQQRVRNVALKVSTGTPYPSAAAYRIRGVFKGGRIAELLGNEVSRVGDFIWKREPPSTSRRSSSAASAKSQGPSDTEKEVGANGTLSKRQSQPHSGRFSWPAESTGKKNSSGPSLSPPEAGDKPSYFMNNLPSFTSPFQNDRELQEEREREALSTLEPCSPDAATPSDHISRAAAYHRSVSKSPRLDRLAPPKLNISRSGSFSGSPAIHRRSSYGSGRTDAFKGPTRAMAELNYATGRSQGPLPVTGLSHFQSPNSVPETGKNWDPSARDTYTKGAFTIVTKRDLARASALLLSSEAKARQISLRAHSIRPRIPQMLLDSVDSSSPETVQSLRVPRKDEHCLAARNLASRSITQSSTFHTSLDHFAATICPSLHSSLQALDDLVEIKLTPRVRATADESGELSMKLITTSTLAVKGLNDVIEGAMRRRRRGPVRWLRRFGYGIVEWLVVGLLWGIWLAVSIVRVGVGTVAVCYRAVRWIFWLD